MVNSSYKEILMKNLLVLFVVIFSNMAFSATTDVGTVSQVYVSYAGHIAVKLNEGIPNITAAGECSGATWVGRYTADPVMKSVLIAAKASGAKVTVSASGCEGGWAKLLGVYMYD